MISASTTNSTGRPGDLVAPFAANGAWPTVRPTAILALAVTLTMLLIANASGGDLSVVPLFDGERADLLNTWGGPFNNGNIGGVTKQTSVVHSGSAAYRANLDSAANGNFQFFQTFSSAVNNTPGYRQDRNLTRYDTLNGYLLNDTGAPFTFTLEIKDYRDSGAHVAKRSVTIPDSDQWQSFSVPLDLSSGWSVTGSPDLSRTFGLGFLFEADFGPLSGPLYLDDVQLVEKGPSIDAATAPITTIVERLAHRQFDALWTARNKTTGIIPNSSDVVDRGALNTTTGVVWTLPAAIRRGWVSQTEADGYMGQLVTSLNTNRDQTNYLPSRFLNLVTAEPFPETNPDVSKEESTIDAAFIALALHNYKSQLATPQPLRESIDALQNRFDFATFAEPNGFNHAYFPERSPPFSNNTYSGYTHENDVIALAAELSEGHHVPLASQWNKDTGRVLASLVDPSQNFLVYSFGTEYRAPFVQALLNLFVDTSDRGADNYSNRTLARNPWANFARYEADVSAKLEQLGRESFFQPDAGAGAGTYQPWNLFNNFGEPDLFQPWSVAFALLAGAPGAEDALRYLLDNGLGGGLDGPLGLADSAQWATGATDPTDVPSFADNWNMTLSLMALMEFLDGPERASRFFADLPEVRSALDTVFIAGDYTGNGVVDAADYNYWKSTFGSTTLLAADGNNNGIIDAGDYTVWRDHLNSGAAGTASSSVPEPAAVMLAVEIWLATVLSGLFKRFTRRRDLPLETFESQQRGMTRLRIENGATVADGRLATKNRKTRYESACTSCFPVLGCGSVGLESEPCSLRSN